MIALLAWCHPTLAADKPGDAFVLDLSAYEKTDPKLRQWDEQTPIPTGLTNLCGVAAGTGDTLYVVGGPILRALNLDGSKRWDASLDAPARCVAVDRSGRMLVGLARNVEVFNGDGRNVDTWPDLGEKALITSISAGAAAVFVADGGQRLVWRFSLDGKLLGRIGDKDPARGLEGFVIPSLHFDVWANADGSAWIANPGELRIEQFRADGTRAATWGQPGFVIEKFCGCCNPADFARLPDGRFVTAEKGLARVKTYDAAGRFLGVVAGPEDFLPDTVGVDVAVDAAGRILLADPRRNTIRIFVPRRAGGPP